MRLSSTLCTHVLKTSSDRDSATFLGKVVAVAVLTVKKRSFLYQNFSWCNLYLLILALSIRLLVKSESLSSL